MKTKLKIGIIGTGSNLGIASAHLEGYRLSPDAEISAVYDTDRAQAERWCAMKGLDSGLIRNSIDALLDASDAVSVTTPNRFHVGYSLQVIGRGKHVICEKPIGVPGDDLDALQRACESTTRVAMVNFNYRRIPGFRMLKKLVENGDLGDIYLYRQTQGGGRLANESIPYEWRMDKTMSGPGALGDFGSHMLDTMDFILHGTGSDFVALDAFESTCIKERSSPSGMKRVQNDDCAIFHGRTSGGTLATFMASRVGALGNQLELVGSKAIARFNMKNPLQVEIQRRKSGEGFGFGADFELWSDESCIGIEAWRTTKSPEMLACAENVMEFVHSAVQGIEPPVSIVQGIRIQKLVNELDVIASGK